MSVNRLLECGSQRAGLKGLDVSCKCSPKCIIQVLCTYGFIHQAADTTLISCSHADLKSCTPNLTMTPPITEILKKYTGRSLSVYLWLWFVG